MPKQKYENKKKTTVLPQTCWELPVVRPTVGGGCRGGDGGKNWHKERGENENSCVNIHTSKAWSEWTQASKQTAKWEFDSAEIYNLAVMQDRKKNTLAEIT